MKDTVVCILSSETDNWMSKKASNLMLLECISFGKLYQRLPCWWPLTGFVFSL